MRAACFKEQKYSRDQVLFYEENLVRIVNVSSDKLWKTEPDTMVLAAFPSEAIPPPCLFNRSQPTAGQ